MNLSPARAPVSLKGLVRRAVATSVAVVAITAAAFAIMTVLVDQFALDMSDGSSTTGPAPETVVRDANDDVTRLIEQHDCWTSAVNTPEDMRGKMPGHTVVTTAESPLAPTYSVDLVGPALDKTFAPDRRTYADVLTVHAFCR